MADSPRSAERLRRLHGLTDVALSHLELEQLLPALVERAEEILGVAECSIVLGKDATDDAPRSVPLLVGGEVIGALVIGSRSSPEPDDGATELAHLVADRIAAAVEHNRLYESERAARVRLEHVQAITDAALAHLEIDELLEVLLPRIRTILGADTCAVLLLDEDRQELVARAAVGIEEEVEQGVRIPVGRGFAGRVAAERRPVILDDVDHADVLNPILREKGIKSLLGVPLLARRGVIGVLHVGTLVPRKFTDEEAELLRLAAERAAAAVEHARLYEAER